MYAEKFRVFEPLRGNEKRLGKSGGSKMQRKVSPNVSTKGANKLLRILNRD